ncbi:MAG TPA: exodeoxyribonuclease VII small subunit [Gammaproteobacteria bacterium]|nr:exodeoxyribonuclease VII small subunit [Gammaproteobacteria bacterium]
MPQKPKLPDLEASLAELSVLIEKMEHGNLTLETSLTRFERGITLIRHAQKILQEAEQKVQILTQKNGNTSLESYENDTE